MLPLGLCILWMGPVVLAVVLTRVLPMSQEVMALVCFVGFAVTAIGQNAVVQRHRIWASLG